MAARLTPMRTRRVNTFAALKRPYGDYAAEPTMQYQIQSKQPMQTAPVTIPYTTPYFAPEANAYQEEIPQLYTDDPYTGLELAAK